MSLSYWMIVGLGLSMKELFPYLQASKIRQRLREQKGSDLNMEDTALWGKINDTERFKLLLEYLTGDFQFADLIAQSDGRHLLSYANDGEDNTYLYYEPSYPWVKSARSDADNRKWQDKTNGRFEYGAPRASGSSRGRHSGEGQGNAAKHDCKREKQLEDRGMAVCPARPNRHFPDCNWGMG